MASQCCLTTSRWCVSDQPRVRQPLLFQPIRFQYKPGATHLKSAPNWTALFSHSLNFSFSYQTCNTRAQINSRLALHKFHTIRQVFCFGYRHGLELCLPVEPCISRRRMKIVSTKHGKQNVLVLAFLERDRGVGATCI